MRRSTQKLPTALAYIEADANKAPSLLALTPLLWLLIPMVLGYSLAERLRHVQALWLLFSLGTVLLGLAWLCSAPLAKAKVRLQPFSATIVAKICLCLGVILLSFVYASYRRPPSSSVSMAISKELTLNLKIDRLFSSSKSYLSGLGYVSSNEAYVQAIKDQAVYFRASKKVNPHVLVQPQLFLKTSLIQTKGVLRTVLEPKNDFERFLKDQDITLYLDHCRFEKVLEAPSAFMQWCDTTAQALEHNLNRGSDPAYSPIYTAMVLGRKGELQADTKRLFSLSGTMHIFAISGLHIGIVAGGLLYISKLLKQNPFAPLWLCNEWLCKGAMLLALGIVYLYVGITGFAPSAERAFAMLSLSSLAYIAKRQTQLFGLLVAAATGMLLWNPFYLQNLGFQLSFAAVGGLALYGLPLGECLSKRLRLDQQPPEATAKHPSRCIQAILTYIVRYLLKAFCLSLGASLACAPLCIQHFKILAYGGIGMNVVLLPLASVSVLLGAASSALACLQLGAISPYLNALATTFIRYMEEWIRVCLKLPGMYASLDNLRAPAGTISLAFVLISMLYIQANRRRSKQLPPYSLPLFVFFSIYLFFVCT